MVSRYKLFVIVNENWHCKMQASVMFWQTMQRVVIFLIQIKQ